MPSNHLILCHPLLLPSIFPSIRVFSNESALCIRWPKYWSFRFSIRSSTGHTGLISFRMDWLDLLAVQGTLRVAIIKESTENKHQRGHGEKRMLLPFCGNVNWCSHYGKWRSLEKLKIGLPYDPAILLLGIYPEKLKTLIQKDLCTPIFIAALFTGAKTWKQPKRPSANG